MTQNFGIWILISFAIYYVVALFIPDKTIGALLLGMILSLGIVLAFF